MIFTYKDITVVMIITFFIGFLISIFLPIKLYMKIILLIVLIIALLIFSLFSFRKRITKYGKKYLKADISGSLDELDKLINKCLTKKGKDILLMYKAIEYLAYNDLKKAEEIVDYYENTNSKMLNDPYYGQTIFLMYLKHKKFDEARKIFDNLKTKMRNDKMACTKFNMYLYEMMRDSLRVYDSNSTDELLDLEKRYLNKFNNDKFDIINIDIASKLIVIYKKLGKKKEEQKYRDYIKEHIGEYYIFID